MGTEHPPRGEQAYLTKPSLWVAEPADGSLPLLANAHREDEPSLCDGEYTEAVYSLLEENARLRRLLVQLTDVTRKNVVQAR